MSEEAKWCLRCGTLHAISDTKCRNPKCGCAFSGNELGSKIEPQLIDTQSQVLSPGAIAGRLNAVSGEGPSEPVSSRREDLRILLRKVGISLVVALAAAAMIAFSRLSAGSGSDGNRGGLGTGLILLLGVVGVLVAMGYLVASVIWFFRVPKFASPQEVADCFYGELLGKGSVSRAWSCLDATARAQFKSVDDFKKYWTTRQNEIKEWILNTVQPLAAGRPKGNGILKSEVALKGVETNASSDGTAVLRCEIIVSAYEQVEARKDLAGNPHFVTVYYGRFIWPQAKTLLRGSTRWYLTSGTLDGLKA